MAQGLTRRADTIAFYAAPGDATPRAALGLLALAELRPPTPGLAHRPVRRGAAVRTSFPYLHGGVLSEPELADLYSEATVGIRYR